MVTNTDNHNKYYKMIPNFPISGQFTAEYGRIGATAMKRVYSMKDWDSKYKEKTRKGYKDKSNLHTDHVLPSDSGEYSPITSPVISSFVQKLQNFANCKLQYSYKVSSAEVTPLMIKEANKLIASLSHAVFITEYNNILLELFSVIPRKMSNVNDFLLKDMKNRYKIIQDEQDLLDVMSAKVSQNQKIISEQTGENKGSTILDAYHLDIRECSDLEISNIKRHLGTETLAKFKNAYRVVNKLTEDKFNTYVNANHLDKKDIHFYYHGSKNENFWGIITEGLRLNPNAVITGKMFGHGLYFASDTCKSIKYTSLKGSYWANGTSDTGFIAVYKVAYKKPLDVYSWESKYKSYRQSDMIRHHTDALFAHKGSMLVNDELIVYQEQQATLRYIIELEL